MEEIVTVYTPLIYLIGLNELRLIFGNTSDMTKKGRAIRGVFHRVLDLIQLFTGFNKFTTLKDMPN